MRGEKRSTRIKRLGAEWRTNKLSPQGASSPGIDPGPHWWKASALTTAPTLLPKKKKKLQSLLLPLTFQMLT